MKVTVGSSCAEKKQQLGWRKVRHLDSPNFWNEILSLALEISRLPAILVPSSDGEYQFFHLFCQNHPGFNEKNRKRSYTFFRWGLPKLWFTAGQQNPMNLRGIHLFFQWEQSGSKLFGYTTEIEQFAPEKLPGPKRK